MKNNIFINIAFCLLTFGVILTAMQYTLIGRGVVLVSMIIFLINNLGNSYDVLVKKGVKIYLYLVAPSFIVVITILLLFSDNINLLLGSAALFFICLFTAMFLSRYIIKKNIDNCKVNHEEEEDVK